MTSHTYNSDIADRVYESAKRLSEEARKIIVRYVPMERRTKLNRCRSIEMCKWRQNRELAGRPGRIWRKPAIGNLELFQRLDNGSRMN